MYVAENVSKENKFTDVCVTAMAELRTSFGMGAKEADAIVGACVRIYTHAHIIHVMSLTHTRSHTHTRARTETTHARTRTPPQRRGIAHSSCR
jgi:hypothetical protein